MTRPGLRRVRRGALALVLLTTTAVAISSPVGGQEAPTKFQTGRGIAVAGVLPILGPIAIADTGPVANTGASATSKSLLLLPNALLSVGAANSYVETRSSNTGALGASQVAGLALGLPGLPVIRLWGVAAWSATTCAGSGGTASIALLQIGTQRINVNTSPNTVLPLGLLTITINEQVRFTTADGGRGLTTSAVHIQGLGINLYVASATSDMHGCTPTTPPTPTDGSNT